MRLERAYIVENTRLLVDRYDVMLVLKRVVEGYPSEDRHQEIKRRLMATASLHIGVEQVVRSFDQEQRRITQLLQYFELVIEPSAIDASVEAAIEQEQKFTADLDSPVVYYVRGDSLLLCGLKRKQLKFVR